MIMRKEEKMKMKELIKKGEILSFLMLKAQFAEEEGQMCFIFKIP